MSKKDSNTGLGEWLQGLSGGLTIAIGFVMTLVGFVQFWQGNSGRVTVVLLVLGVLTQAS